MTFTCSNMKLKVILGWLVCNAHSTLVLMQICALSLKVCVFSEQEDQTPMKMGHHLVGLVIIREKAKQKRLDSRISFKREKGGI